MRIRKGAWTRQKGRLLAQPSSGQTFSKAVSKGTGEQQVWENSIFLPLVAQ